MDGQRCYILAIIQRRLQVMHRKRAAVEADLDAMGFDRMASNGTIVRNAHPIVAEPELSDEEDEEEGLEVARL